MHKDLAVEEDAPLQCRREPAGERRRRHEPGVDKAERAQCGEVTRQLELLLQRCREVAQNLRLAEDLVAGVGQRLVGLHAAAQPKRYFGCTHPFLKVARMVAVCHPRVVEVQVGARGTRLGHE